MLIEASINGLEPIVFTEAALRAVLDVALAQHGAVLVDVLAVTR